MENENRHNLDQDSLRVSKESSGAAETLLERRKLIKAAIASVPIVLTVTAGRARAQDTGSAVLPASAPISDTPMMDEGNLLGDGSANAISAEAASEFSSEELQILNEGTK